MGKALLPILAALIFLAPPSTAAGQAPPGSEPNVSLDDPVYDLLDRLDTLGLLDTYVNGIRPVSRSEAARLLLEARELMARRPGRMPAALDQEVDAFLRRFRWNAAARWGFGSPPPVLADATGGTDGPAVGEIPAKPSIYFFPVASLQARMDALSGWSRPEGLRGRDATHGASVRLSLEAHGRALSVLSWHVRPEVGVEPDRQYGAEGDFVFRETYLKVTGLGLELQVGLDDLTWGPGRHGGIILSRNAGSLPLVRLGTPSPIRLPWIFSYIGDIRFDFFVARMEESRPVPHALLAGLKVNFKPLPWLELGLSRTVMFGGEGRPGVDADMVWKIWWGTHDNPHGGAVDISNQLAGFDGRVRFNLWGVGVSLYGEAIGEDEVNMFPYKWSTIAGLAVEGLPPEGRLGLRLEWAHTHRVAYRHGTYAGGYRYRGDLLGHHVGRDGKDIYLAVTLHPGVGLRVTAFVDWEARRENGSFQPLEEHVQAGLRVRATHGSSPRLSVEMEYRYRHVRNAGYVRDVTESEHYVGVVLQWVP